MIPGARYKNQRKSNSGIESIMSEDKVNPDINASVTIPVEGMLKHKNIWHSIGWLITLVIIILSLIPDPLEMTPFSASDKLMHTLAYGVSMLWFGLCFKGKKVIVIGAGLILLGIVLEVIQGQTGYRTMSFYDIVANCTGVFIGLVLSFSPLSRSLQYIEQRFLK